MNHRIELAKLKYNGKLTAYFSQIILYNEWCVKLTFDDVQSFIFTSCNRVLPPRGRPSGLYVFHQEMRSPDFTFYTRWSRWLFPLAFVGLKVKIVNLARWFRSTHHPSRRQIVGHFQLYKIWLKRQTRQYFCRALKPWGVSSSLTAWSRWTSSFLAIDVCLCCCFSKSSSYYTSYKTVIICQFLSIYFRYCCLLSLPRLSWRLPNPPEQIISHIAL